MQQRDIQLSYLTSMNLGSLVREGGATDSCCPCCIGIRSVIVPKCLFPPHGHLGTFKVGLVIDSAAVNTLTYLF